MAAPASARPYIRAAAPTCHSPVRSPAPYVVGPFDDATAFINCDESLT